MQVAFLSQKRLLVDVSSILLIEHQANSIQILNCAGCVSLLYNYAHKSFVAYTKLLGLHDCFSAMQEPKSAMVFSFSCSANRRLPWILALLLMMTRGDGQSTPGFLSVDCGFTNDSPYKDSTTGLLFLPDLKFVEGGVSNNISAAFMADAPYENQKTLRSFPQGKRNCYTLPSTIGKKFLLRAMFTYGNYDGLNRSMDGSPFLFGLHIGVNFWDTVNLTNMDPSITDWKEVLTIAPSNFVSFCLINFGSGTPFVSSLELRPLLDPMYPFVNTRVSVGYFRRIRFGNATEYITRYPTDPYDRFWEGWSFSYSSYPWISPSTSNKVEILPGDDYFNVPMAIFQKATTLDANYSFMSLGMAKGPNWDHESVRLLPIFHFAEINGSNPNRRFDIYNEGDLLHRGFSPSLLQANSLHDSGRFLYNGNALYTLNKTRSSILPPLINALEVYSLIRMENFTTDSEDGKIDHQRRYCTHIRI
ncbi:probable LRR receptor-like serine/threonine-protein kinase At1g05700 [Triticum dicoccoides]|uniref:probable LRR receptor-like serine/threonine-protein kinase At1g05700 n=1 Tax=Triticum dicoccoides TaxID=85692 RepID=UPI000E7C9B87|nr:probable LRR receptor-like serine/threonine-protein kinase At1g05700 [Triticum dicoccoides]